MTIAKKIRQVTGWGFVGYAWARILWPVASWLQHPELTEMQFFLAQWKQLVGACIVHAVGTAILAAWRPIPPYRPQLSRETEPHYKVNRRGRGRRQ